MNSMQFSNLRCSGPAEFRAFQNRARRRVAALPSYDLHCETSVKAFSLGEIRAGRKERRRQEESALQSAEKEGRLLGLPRLALFGGVHLARPEAWHLLEELRSRRSVSMSLGAKSPRFCNSPGVLVRSCINRSIASPVRG